MPAGPEITFAPHLVPIPVSVGRVTGLTVRNLLTIAICAWLFVLLGAAHAFDRSAKIAHFTTDVRDTGFVLDQSGPVPRVKFDGTQEVLAAWWQPAAGGDRILVRDDGVLILRQNVGGGMTLFTAQFPMGVPVTFDRPAMPLEGPPPPIDTVRDTAREASEQVSQNLGITIRFDGPWDRAAQDAGLRAILFDAVQNAGAAFRLLSAEPAARARVARTLRGVHFTQGPRPGVTRQRSIAVVIYTLEHGVAARPSSYRIAHEIKLQFR